MTERHNEIKHDAHKNGNQEGKPTDKHTYTYIEE